MAFDLDEVLKKRNAIPPEARERFDVLIKDVDHNMMYAKHVLNTIDWWLGYRGALMGTPTLTTDPNISTACVTIDPVTGMIDYYFNVYFAASLSPGDIAFIMAHECLHLVLGHLELIDVFKIEFHQIWNVVCDAFINEYLHRSLRWKKGAKEPDKIDWVTSNGIRWEDLPEEIQKKHPMDQVKGEVEVTAIEIYDEFIAYLKMQGVDPNKFEKAVEQKNFGRKVQRRKRQEQNQRGSGEKREVIYQKTYAETGDIVWVKSKRKYGIIKDLRRTKDQKGEADIDCNTDLTDDDYHRLNRAVGITGALKKKTYPLTRKIVDVYAKLKASEVSRFPSKARPGMEIEVHTAGEAEPAWSDIAKAVGVPEINELTDVDIAMKEYDERTLMSPEEIEAESIRRHNELVRKARATRQAIASRGGGRWEM